MPKPDDSLDRLFPGGFSTRDEANAITAYAFRNGFLETLHAGKQSPLLSDKSLSRITQDEMKTLMIEASSRVAKLLEEKEKNPQKYREMIQGYNLMYCRNWVRDDSREA